VSGTRQLYARCCYTHVMLENKSNQKRARTQHLLHIVGRSSALKNMHSYQATTVVDPARRSVLCGVLDANQSLREGLRVALE
jgi:hypothetical protein